MKLAEGGFGQVFDLGHGLVTKRTPNDHKESTWREMYVLKQVPPHENLLHGGCLETNPLRPGTVDMILKKAPERDLVFNLKRLHQLSLPQFAEMIFQIFAGLQALHDNGIVHRDIKPGNILVLSWPEPGDTITAPHIVLADFGLAHMIQGGYPFGPQAGTPCYMPPESLCHARQDENWSVTTSQDVYAAGMTALHLLASWISPHGDFQGFQRRCKVSSRHAQAYSLLQQLSPNGSPEIWERFCSPLQQTRQQHDLQTNKPEKHPFDLFVDLFGFVPSKKGVTKTQMNHLLDLLMACIRFDPSKRPTINPILRSLLPLIGHNPTSPLMPPIVSHNLLDLKTSWKPRHPWPVFVKQGTIQEAQELIKDILFQTNHTQMSRKTRQQTIALVNNLIPTLNRWAAKKCLIHTDLDYKAYFNVLLNWIAPGWDFIPRLRFQLPIDTWQRCRGHAPFNPQSSF